MRLSARSHRAIAFPCRPPSGFRAGLRYRWVGVDGVKAAAAATHRLAMPITAYVGPNGGGKSAAAVYDSLGTLAGDAWSCTNLGHLHRHAPDCRFRRIGQMLGGLVVDDSGGARPDTCDCDLPGPTSGERYVTGTVLLWDPDTPQPYTSLHPRYRPLVRLRDLAYVEHCDVILDEVTGVASARSHQSLPVQIENLLMQLRRRDALLRITTPDFSAADVRIRQVTQEVVYCRGFDVRFVPGRKWSDRRLLRWSSYDAAAFDEFTVAKRGKLVPEGRQFFWRPGHLIERVYDTSAPVIALGVATEGGMCLHCGGSRSRARCSCPADEDSLGEGVVETVTAAGSRTRRLAADA